MNLMWDYLSDADNWGGDGGIGDRLVEHAALCLIALAVAAAIALPIGTLVGHGRRGDDLPIAIGALGRLLPPLGVFTYLALKFDTGDRAVLVALILLAMPPMMSAAYTGVRLVDASAIASARGAGMQPGQVLRSVEIPMALPEIVAGLRKSARQVVPMAAVGAYIGAGGLGRLILDGQTAEVPSYGMVATGGVLLAVLAVVLDAAIAAGGRAFTSPGLSSRSRVPAAAAPARPALSAPVPGAPPPPLT